MAGPASFLSGRVSNSIVHHRIQKGHLLPCPGGCLLAILMGDEVDPEAIREPNSGLRRVVQAAQARWTLRSGVSQMFSSLSQAWKGLSLFEFVLPLTRSPATDKMQIWSSKRLHAICEAEAIRERSPHCQVSIPALLPGTLR